MSRPTDKYLTGFKTNIKEFLEFVSDILTELIEDKIIDHNTVNVQALDLAKALLGSYDGRQLITDFMGCHRDWHHISTRDQDFIFKTVPETYRNLPVDISILTLPLKLYQEHENEKDFPITSEDVDHMWEYFKVMVVIACRYIHASRLPCQRENALVYSNPDFREEIDLKRYVDLFSFTL